MADHLASLSTEGDFGRDTLQAVAETLAQAIAENPPADENGEPADPYQELAKLIRYEHVQIPADSPQMKRCMEALELLDKKRAAADFTVQDLQGKSWTLHELRGKVVLVNFWATWCPPCRKEMPDLEDLHRHFKDKGLVVLGISDEPLEKLQPFIKEQRYSYPILMDVGRKVSTEFVIDGIPKTFVFDREGRLVAQSIDMRTKKQFLQMLAEAGLKK